VSEITHNSDLAQLGSPTIRRVSNWQQATLRAGDDVTVFREKVPDDKVAFTGHGGRNKLVGQVAYLFAEVVASGNGAGTAGDPIEGELIECITDSDGRIVDGDERTIGDLQNLAEAANDNRTERPLHPIGDPGAEPGRYVEYRIVPEKSVDGYEINPDASSGKLYQTRFDKSRFGL
jgi:hypothetical protein